MPLMSVSCGTSVAITTLLVVVECKGDLNASRTPLVLEHNIKKYIRPRKSGSSVPSAANPTLMQWLSACTNRIVSACTSFSLGGGCNNRIGAKGWDP